MRAHRPHDAVGLWPKAAERVQDVEWIERVASENWVALTADKLRYESYQRLALIEYRVRVFRLSNGNLSGLAQRRLLVNHLPAMLRLIPQPGPWIAVVYEDRVVRTWPRPTE